MGPVVLFDKSFLESLSEDESVWFDNFFLSNVCPIFFVETLADLKKSLRNGRTPEQHVGVIADKFPEMGGSPCVFHADLCVANLLGNNIPLSWKIPLAKGYEIQTENKKGVVFHLSPEAESFMRWQKREFLDIERLFAKTWRRLLISPSREDANQSIRAIGINYRSCKTLQEAKAIAEAAILSEELKFEKMKFAAKMFNIDRREKRKILKHWHAKGFTSLALYAPYAAFVIMIEIFFLIALATNQISSERASNRTDIGYLYYLPFCHVFVSSDKLHRRCAPLFIRQDQEFVWGQDLKRDLNKLNDYYSLLPQDKKDKGLMSFAPHPPSDRDFLVTRLWDKHLLKREELNFPQEEDQRITSQPDDSKDVDWMIIQRSVHKKRGSWYQLPKDFKES